MSSLRGFTHDHSKRWAKLEGRVKNKFVSAAAIAAKKKAEAEAAAAAMQSQEGANVVSTNFSMFDVHKTFSDLSQSLSSKITDKEKSLRTAFDSAFADAKYAMSSAFSVTDQETEKSVEAGATSAAGSKSVGREAKPEEPSSPGETAQSSAVPSSANRSKAKSKESSNVSVGSLSSNAKSVRSIMSSTRSIKSPKGKVAGKVAGKQPLTSTTEKLADKVADKVADKASTSKTDKVAGTSTSEKVGKPSTTTTDKATGKPSTSTSTTDKVAGKLPVGSRKRRQNTTRKKKQSSARKESSRARTLRLQLELVRYRQQECLEQILAFKGFPKKKNRKIQPALPPGAKLAPIVEPVPALFDSATDSMTAAEIAKEEGRQQRRFSSPSTSSGDDSFPPQLTAPKAGAVFPSRMSSHQADYHEKAQGSKETEAAVSSPPNSLSAIVASEERVEPERDSSVKESRRNDADQEAKFEESEGKDEAERKSSTDVKETRKNDGVGEVTPEEQSGSENVEPCDDRNADDDQATHFHSIAPSDIERRDPPPANEEEAAEPISRVERDMPSGKKEMLSGESSTVGHFEKTGTGADDTEESVASSPREREHKDSKEEQDIDDDDDGDVDEQATHYYSIAAASATREPRKEQEPAGQTTTTSDVSIHQDESSKSTENQEKSAGVEAATESDQKEKRMESPERTALSEGPTVTSAEAKSLSTPERANHGEAKSVAEVEDAIRSDAPSNPEESNSQQAMLGLQKTVADFATERQCGESDQEDVTHEFQEEKKDDLHDEDALKSDDESEDLGEKEQERSPDDRLPQTNEKDQSPPSHAGMEACVPAMRALVAVHEEIAPTEVGTASPRAERADFFPFTKEQGKPGESQTPKAKKASQTSDVLDPQPSLSSEGIEASTVVSAETRTVFFDCFTAADGEKRRGTAVDGACNEPGKATIEREIRSYTEVPWPKQKNQSTEDGENSNIEISSSQNLEVAQSPRLSSAHDSANMAVEGEAPIEHSPAVSLSKPASPPLSMECEQANDARTKNSADCKEEAHLVSQVISSPEESLTDLLVAGAGKDQKQCDDSKQSDKDEMVGSTHRRIESLLRAVEQPQSLCDADKSEKKTELKGETEMQAGGTSEVVEDAHPLNPAVAGTLVAGIESEGLELQQQKLLHLLQQRQHQQPVTSEANNSKTPPHTGALAMDATEAMVPLSNIPNPVSSPNILIPKNDGTDGVAAADSFPGVGMAAAANPRVQRTQVLEDAPVISNIQSSETAGSFDQEMIRFYALSNNGYVFGGTKTYGRANKSSDLPPAKTQQREATRSAKRGPKTRSRDPKGVRVGSSRQLHRRPPAAPRAIPRIETDNSDDGGILLRPEDVNPPIFSCMRPDFLLTTDGESSDVEEPVYVPSERVHRHGRRLRELAIAKRKQEEEEAARKEEAAKQRVEDNQRAEEIDRLVLDIQQKQQVEQKEEPENSQDAGQNAAAACAMSPEAQQRSEEGEKSLTAAIVGTAEEDEPNTTTSTDDGIEVVRRTSDDDNDRSQMFRDAQITRDIVVVDEGNVDKLLETVLQLKMEIVRLQKQTCMEELRQIRQQLGGPAKARKLSSAAQVIPPPARISVVHSGNHFPFDHEKQEIFARREPATVVAATTPTSPPLDGERERERRTKLSKGNEKPPLPTNYSEKPPSTAQEKGSDQRVSPTQEKSSEKTSSSTTKKNRSDKNKSKKKGKKDPKESGKKDKNKKSKKQKSKKDVVKADSTFEEENFEFNKEDVYSFSSGESRGTSFSSTDEEDEAVEQLEHVFAPRTMAATVITEVALQLGVIKLNQVNFGDDTDTDSYSEEEDDDGSLHVENKVVGDGSDMDTLSSCSSYSDDYASDGRQV